MSTPNDKYDAAKAWADELRKEARRAREEADRAERIAQDAEEQAARLLELANEAWAAQYASES